MNQKSALVLRVILGGYLVFLGVSVLMQAWQTHPSDLVIKTVFGVVFMLVGMAYAGNYIWKAYRMVYPKKEKKIEPGQKNENRRIFRKPKHDESILRTAPMPGEEELRRETSFREIDLRENMKYLHEAEAENTENPAEEQTANTEDSALEQAADAETFEEKQEQAADIETFAETETTDAEKPVQKQAEDANEAVMTESKKEPSAEQDPVRMAIEIMRDEDMELSDLNDSPEEDLEKDYEEK